MKNKERFMKYVAICERAENEGLYNGERFTLLMDIENADEVFNLRLDDLLQADKLNFAHDIYGIINNINRSVYPVTDFGLFVPRYSGRE